jgi:hypothetical protein
MGNSVCERTYTAQLKDRAVKVTSRDLAKFREMYLGTSELTDRMSELIWLDIYILDAAFGAGTHEILRAIKDLEHGEPLSGVKPATQFENMPLKGLWHKHFFSAHFLVENIILGLGKTELERLVSEAMDAAKSTAEMINELAHRVTHEPLETRNASKKLTGEWIVYLRHAGKNYYLCCNTHTHDARGDQFIYDRIMEHCVRDFPLLPAWLKAQQNS